MPDRYQNYQEINSKSSAFGKIMAEQFIMLVVIGGVAYLLKDRVIESLSLIYMIFSVVMGILLIVPGTWNRERYNFCSCYLYFRRKRVFYKSIH